MKPSIMNRLRSKHNVAALAIMLTYIALAVAYSMVTPLWEAPDEVGHAGYVMYLRQSHTLPVQRIGSLGSSHHPPLYYLIAELISAPADINDPTGTIRPNPDFMWAGSGGSDVNIALHGSAETFPYRGQALLLHLARLASVMMGLITVALVIAIGWHIFGEYPWIGLLAGALTAFLPQFLLISGAINNDNLLDESGQLVAQKDHAPGEGLGYPPTAWNVEDILADEHVLHIPPPLSPGTYRIRVGMYNWKTGEQLPVTAQDRAIGTFTLLDRPYTRR